MNDIEQRLLNFAEHHKINGFAEENNDIKSVFILKKTNLSLH